MIGNQHLLVEMEGGGGCLGLGSERAGGERWDSLDGAKSSWNSLVGVAVGARIHRW